MAKTLAHDHTIVISKRKDGNGDTVRTIHVIGTREWPEGAGSDTTTRMQVNVDYTGTDTLTALEAAVEAALKTEGGIS